MATYAAKITINSSTKKVFETLTHPELTRQWQFGREIKTSWEVGSEIRFTTAFNGQILEQRGKVLAIRPNELITYSLFTPHPDLEDVEDNYTVTSYILTSQANHTQVQIVQTDNRSDRFVPVSLDPILASLKQIAEKD